MSTDTVSTFDDSFAKYINEAVKDAVADAFDKALEEAYTEAKKKRDEAIASITLRLSNYYSIERAGNTIRIEIIKEQDNA